MDYLVKIRSVQTPLNGQFSIGANSLLGIGLYLVFHYALDIGHEVYSLSLSSAISSASANIYHEQFLLTIQLLELPLLGVLVLGGLPLLY